MHLQEPPPASASQAALAMHAAPHNACSRHSRSHVCFVVRALQVIADLPGCDAALWAQQLAWAAVKESRPLDACELLLAAASLGAAVRDGEVESVAQALAGSGQWDEAGASGQWSSVACTAAIWKGWADAFPCLCSCTELQSKTILVSALPGSPDLPSTAGAAAGHRISAASPATPGGSSALGQLHAAVQAAVSAETPADLCAAFCGLELGSCDVGAEWQLAAEPQQIWLPCLAAAAVEAKAACETEVSAANGQRKCLHACALFTCHCQLLPGASELDLLSLPLCPPPAVCRMLSLS